MTVEQHQRTGQSEILTIKQGFVAGIVASLVMATVAMVGSSLIGMGFWTPINAIGSFFLGGGAEPIPSGPAGAVTG